MKADSLPEEPNNLKPQVSEETNAPEASQPAQIPLTSETLANEESTSDIGLPPAEVSFAEALASKESETSEVLHSSETSLTETVGSEEVHIQDAPDTGENSLPETVASDEIDVPDAPDAPETPFTETVGSEEVHIQDAPETGENSLPETVASDKIDVPDAPDSPETPFTKTVGSEESNQPDVPNSPEPLRTETVASDTIDAPDLSNAPETSLTAKTPETPQSPPTSPTRTFSYPLNPWGIPREVSSQVVPSTEVTPEKPGGDSMSGLPREASFNKTPKVTPLEKVVASAPELESDPYPFDPEKKNKRVFITGASGCIGHYIVETLIRDTEYELYLLVRNPDKLQFDCHARPGIHVMQGEMRDIGRYRKLLKTIDFAVLVAASWGGQSETLDTNVLKPLQLLELLDLQVCQQVIYFSTASVLDKNSEVLKEAVQLGTDYIRTKADFLRRVSRLPIAKRMTVLFPTLVLGGDDHHPYSHLSGGLPGLTKWIDLIRWFKADASFHFIHGKDIAAVVRYLIEHPPNPEDSRWLVLGNPPISVNQAVEEACAYLNRRIFFRLPLSPWLANLFIVLFNIRMSAWDRFCLDYRNFTYENPVNPATFGLPVYCSTFTDVLKISGVSDSRD